MTETGQGQHTAGLPWEERQSGQFLQAFVETLRLIATRPADAFSRVRPRGDLTDPLLFAVIVFTLATTGSQITGLMVQTSFLTVAQVLVPPETWEQLSFMPTWAATSGGAVAILMTLIIAPILGAISLFIGASIYHVSLMLVGGLENSSAGFEGTFRAYCYTYVASLASILPFIGSLIYGVWLIFLLVIGLRSIHRTSTGRAVAAVLLPTVLCCLLMLGTCAFVIMAIASADMVAH